MTGESGSLEGLLSGAGIAVAAAVLMLVALMLFGSTSPENSSIRLQNVASEVCGDIGTVAISSIPYNRSETYPADGITIRVTSDYVLVGGTGHEFARPLPIRVFPGSYGSPDMIFWNDTGELREYLNRTVGSAGSEERPFNQTEDSQAKVLMEQACRAMASNPLCLNPVRPLTIEKLFMYRRYDNCQGMESDAYVFVYQ